MSFAQAFNEIWSRIFGQTYRKPRLKKVRGFWVCQSADRPETKGFTPASAYGAWRNLRDEFITIEAALKEKNSDQP